MFILSILDNFIFVLLELIDNPSLVVNMSSILGSITENTRQVCQRKFHIMEDQYALKPGKHRFLICKTPN